MRDLFSYNGDTDSDTHDKMECHCHGDSKEDTDEDDGDDGDSRQCQLGSSDQVSSDWLIVSIPSSYWSVVSIVSFTSAFDID